MAMIEPQKRANYLLVIGIDEYLGGIYPKLKNAVRDCNKVSKLLNEKYGFEYIHPPIFNEQATRKKIINELSAIKFSTTKEDNLIIYFAGHGFMNPHTRRGYWVPVDASGSDADLIPNSTIKDKIEDLECKHVFLMCDACFSGTFLTQTRSIALPTAFAEADKLKSRWYLSSGREEPVSDGEKDSGSPFCNSLLTVLESNQSKYLMVSELISKATILTSSHTAHAPIGGPIYVSGNDLGEMIFSKNDFIVRLSGDQLSLLSQTYGFYIGQKLQIDFIKQNFSELKQVVLLFEHKWELKYGSSIERIVTNLMAHYGSLWAPLSAQISKQIKENNVRIENLEDAAFFLSLLEERLGEGIPSPIYETLVLNIPEIASYKPLEFMKGHRRTLHSTESLKSKGLNFIVEVPLSWNRQDGKRPNVLWLLTANNMEVSCVITVHLISDLMNVALEEIEEAGDEAVSEHMLNREYLENQFKGLALANTFYRKTFLSGQPCAILQFQSEQQNLLQSIETYTRLYSIVYKNYLITINFILPKQFEHYYPQFEIFFDSIANTLIIEDMYI